MSAGRYLYILFFAYLFPRPYGTARRRLFVVLVVACHRRLDGHGLRVFVIESVFIVSVSFLQYISCVGSVPSISKRLYRKYTRNRSHFWFNQTHVHSYERKAILNRVSTPLGANLSKNVMVRRPPSRGWLYVAPIGAFHLPSSLCYFLLPLDMTPECVFISSFLLLPWLFFTEKHLFDRILCVFRPHSLSCLAWSRWTCGIQQRG